MDLFRPLHFFIAPLFGIVLLCMFWKRATPLAVCPGLLGGTLTAIGIFLSIFASWITTWWRIALSPGPRGWAQDACTRRLWVLLGFCVPYRRGKVW